VASDTARIDGSRRLAAMTTTGQVDAFADELRDRFGPLPESVGRWLELQRIRVLALAAGVHAISVRAQVLRIETATGLVRTPQHSLPRLHGTTADEQLAEIRIWLDRLASGRRQPSRSA
jgi:transcription-repair coupling factor (superfamily II helicase)